MRTVLLGGSGFIGSALSARLGAEGWTVDSPERPYDFTPGGPLAGLLEGADGVVNLSGAPIAGKRFTAAYKEVLRASRIGLTGELARLLGTLRQPPPVLVNASASGYYAADDAPKPETAPSGRGFLSALCRDWEGAAAAGEECGIRVVRIRTAVVLGNGGGALPQLVLPFRFFVGGPLGPGAGWRSWIHLDDIVAVYLRALEDPSMSGPVNGCSPDPIRNSAFAAALGRSIGRPSWLPVPEAALRLVFGGGAEVIAGGCRQEPEVLQTAGFAWTYPDLGGALLDLTGSSRSSMLRLI